jgi:hypothetical protein
MTANTIREAARAGDYETAGRLFAEYAQSLPLDEASLVQMQELMRQIRIAALCECSHAEARLRAARKELNVLLAYAR